MKKNFPPLWFTEYFIIPPPWNPNNFKIFDFFLNCSTCIGAIFPAEVVHSNSLFCTLLSVCHYHLFVPFSCSYEQSHFTAALSGKTGFWWIGLRARGGAGGGVDYIWDDGSSLSFTHWDRNQPGTDLTLTYIKLASCCISEIFHFFWSHWLWMENQLSLTSALYVEGCGFENSMGHFSRWFVLVYIV